MKLPPSFHFRKLRKNPLWFNILTLAVIIVEFTSIFFVQNPYYLSGSQFTMTIFASAYGIKEWRTNTVISIIMFTLALLFVYVSLQTLAITWR
ncbi:hypothetical protein HQN89_33700 [Paenibacillus frigoriresistens]|uniref:hypothetical protein n=1 Tax=Paenibacillus alginolyticus TaxID=59839 RepID=UPI001564084B|nr:hypothetical protein [Paenibacillus frigoriresistens]NRF95784.1 hypothetical protein [Paenibacillus frigoriresistens]